MQMINKTIKEELKFTITLSAIIPAIIIFFYDKYNYNNLYNPSLAFWMPFCFWMLVYILNYEKISKQIEIFLKLNYIFLALFVFLMALNGFEDIAKLSTTTIFFSIYEALFFISVIGLVTLPLILFVIELSKKGKS